MRRVVITGMGIVSSLGNNLKEVTESLRAGKSGIEKNQEQVEHGFRSQVAGTLKLDPAEFIDRKLMRFMGQAAAYNYIAMQEAIEQSGLTDEQVSNPRTGLITGSGGSSCQNIVATADIAREKSIKRVGPYMVPRTMASTTSACLATPFKIKGVNYSLSSACATSAHCIGAGVEQIQFGKQDVIFAGGGEELHWSLSAMFDAMGALSSNFNDTPERASRPYDVNRDGFVIAGGGGTVVLESLEHA
ncbi:MAG TPA: beta-ketoacyl-ACP synthase I, partial [Halothiobacillaceae bacterium]|nr:beta-ketoacyl-ACP synthase I [Halothiobacillaceae bacterium]